MSTSTADPIHVPEESSPVARLPARLQRIASLLACPTCKGDLEHQADGLGCRACNRIYPIRAGKIYFIQSLGAEDALDVVKHRLKRYLGSLYYTVGVNILAPSFPFSYAAAIRKHVDPGRNSLSISAAAIVVSMTTSSHWTPATMMQSISSRGSKPFPSRLGR